MMYNDNCVSTTLYNKMNEYIDNCNIHDKRKLECVLWYESIYENNYCEFIEMMIYFNDTKQHPLKKKF